jgi:small-conductance mechanosensitive channel
MTFDELQKSWQAQQVDPRLVIDSELLLKEVKRSKEYFESAILRRDIREIGCAVLLAAFFLYFAIKYNLWPIWLLAILCLWIAVFMFVDRTVQRKKQPCLSDSLFNCIKSSLTQVNHQIWLLKNVLWWSLLPLGAGLIIWFCYCGLSAMLSENPSTKYLLFILMCVVSTLLLYWGVYWLNQYAVRKELLPRKQELEQLLNSLKNSHD